MSGPTFSIPDIANALANLGYYVEFVSYPSSNYNPQISRKVKLVKTADLNSDLFIVDVSCNHEFVTMILAKGKKVITTIHGKLNSLHGLDTEYVKRSVSISNMARFVSPAQQESFQLPLGKFVIIPNMAAKVLKSKFTNNIGVVGNLTNTRKNANLTVELGLKSSAKKIQLWGVGSDFICDYKSVIAHGWETNKEKIFNSFDVLVFLSSEENCPKAVVEALSAGIPCVLSDISAHRVFSECDGVRLISLNEPDAGVVAINEFLENKEALRDNIIKFWEENFSEKVFAQYWQNLIEDLLGQEQTFRISREDA